MEKRKQFGLLKLHLHGELPPKTKAGHSEDQRWGKS